MERHKRSAAHNGWRFVKLNIQYLVNHRQLSRTMFISYSIIVRYKYLSDYDSIMSNTWKFTGYG